MNVICIPIHTHTTKQISKMTDRKNSKKTKKEFETKWRHFVNFIVFSYSRRLCACMLVHVRSCSFMFHFIMCSLSLFVASFSFLYFSFFFFLLLYFYGCCRSFLLKMAPMSFIKTFGKLSSNICLRLSHIKKILTTTITKRKLQKQMPETIKAYKKFSITS